MSIKRFKEFLNESSEDSQQHQYMMLSRLQSDCEYFLGNGKGSERNLYYKNVEEHISEMKNLWNQLVVKPEWLSLEDINEYEDKMLNYNDNNDNPVDNSTELDDVDIDVKNKLDKIRKNQQNAKND